MTRGAIVNTRVGFRLLNDTVRLCHCSRFWEWLSVNYPPYIEMLYIWFCQKHCLWGKNGWSDSWKENNMKEMSGLRVVISTLLLPGCLMTLCQAWFLCSSICPFPSEPSSSRLSAQDCLEETLIKVHFSKNLHKC